MGEGGLPGELIEADICEKFGWTFAELDEQDQDRVYAGVVLQNIRDSIQRIKNWVDTLGRTHISNDDMELWGTLMKARRDDGRG